MLSLGREITISGLYRAREQSRVRYDEARHGRGESSIGSNRLSKSCAEPRGYSRFPADI
jgi:hypothetical protein